jgi:hypothetical protein
MSTKPAAEQGENGKNLRMGMANRGVIDCEHDTQKEEQEEQDQAEESIKKEGAAKEKGAREEARSTKEGSKEEWRGAGKEPARGHRNVRAEATGSELGRPIR